MAAPAIFSKPIAPTVARAAILGAALLLCGCAAAEPASLPIAGCQQQAQALGFRVLSVDSAQAEPEGTVVPVLVDWSQNGGAHLDCRPDAGGGVTIG